MKKPTDTIDRLIHDWESVRPDLDPLPLALVGRVLVLARQLETRAERALAAHKLTLGQFDILATLRRAGSGGLNPKALMQSVALSSGGMTSRLDRLEELGYVRRQPDPADRRGVVVVLTKTGERLIDAATATRFAEAAQSLPALPARDRMQLEGYLRKWLIQLGK